MLAGPAERNWKCFARITVERIGSKGNGLLPWPVDGIDVSLSRNENTERYGRRSPMLHQ